MNNALNLYDNSRIKITDNVLARELDGELILLNLDTEYYYGLDQTGTRIWQALSESATVGQAIDLLLDEYEVEPETLAADVNELITQLIDKKLVSVAP